MKAHFILFLSLLFLTVNIVAQDTKSFFLEGDYPESASVRVEVVESWFLSSPLKALSNDTLFLTNYLEESYVFSNNYKNKEGVFTQTVAPLQEKSLRGTWILTRKFSDGTPLSIKIYPNKNENVYIEFYPWQNSVDSGKSLASTYLYDFCVSKNVAIGLPFTRLYSLSLNEIANLTANTIPWNLLAVEPNLSYDIESMVAEIRESLPFLVYHDDGAFDENNYPVYIASGNPQDKDAVRKIASESNQDISSILGGVNCSGFAKWIVDGVVRQTVGSGIKIMPLKSQTSSPETYFTEPYRNKRDLFFGLDWIRNLASARVSAMLGKTLTPDVSGIDVKIDIFPDEIGYKKDVGYKVDQIIPLLYWLAINEPNHFYLGALSRERGEPALRQFHHIAAFFPWIDSGGNFRLVVFESAVETESDVFVERNSDAWIYLVRIKSAEAGYFYP